MMLTNYFEPKTFKPVKNKGLKQTNYYYMTDVIGENNGLNCLNISNYKKDQKTFSFLAQVNIPESHKRVANSYVFVKQIFGTPVVHSYLTKEENQLLARFDFCPLEYTTSKQMEEELQFLKKWSSQRDKDLCKLSDRVIQVRAKELKHLIATNYVGVKKDLYDGYKLLDKYFQEITKYNRKN